MFTGIITGIGHIIQVASLGVGPEHGKHLTIQAPPQYLEGACLGESIAINGACMTLAKFGLTDDSFEVDISAESLRKTTGLATNGRVNLERALCLSDRLGGHFLSGHVDGLGVVVQFNPVGESWVLGIQAPPELGQFLAYKGSVGINGVSLTINSILDQNSQEGVLGACQFFINLIPHTMSQTTLGDLQKGSWVNLEIDLIARYCERLLTHQHTFSSKSHMP